MNYDKLFLKLFISLSLIYIAFMVKPWANVSGNIYPGDDNSYYGYTSSIVNDFDFDFANNQLSGHGGLSPATGKIQLYHPIGTSLLLIPFYVLAKPIVVLVDILNHSPFEQRHPLFFIFMCSGVMVYAYWGSFLLYRAVCQLGIKPKTALISVTLSLWGTILPAYIFKRPIFSTIPEFFLISALIFLVVQFKPRLANIKYIFFLSLLCGLLIVTRWNDLHIIFFIFYFLLVCQIQAKGFKKEIVFKILFFFGVIFLIFFLTQGLAWKSFLGSFFKPPYNPLGIGKTARVVSSHTINNLLHIFIARDWGLFYTMLPFLAGTVAFFIFLPLPLSKNKLLDFLVYLLVFLLPFAIVVKAQKQGSYYGYRHLLSLLPFATLGLAAFLNMIYEKTPKADKVLTIITVLIISFNFFLMLPFEYHDSTTLKRSINIMGREGFNNDAYVFNALKLYFTLPARDLAGMFCRGYAAG
ncbi:MAG: hypothetical protein JW867_07270, partial [Candidatus Omnitrophica bacterium]|nr:hypothetical protein [Candidatus Omnitrophota bacterium]